MTAATLGHMPRKLTQNEPSQNKTTAVRIQADLARMLGIISKATNEDVSDILSPQIRSFVERRYAEVVRQLGKEVKTND